MTANKIWFCNLVAQKLDVYLKVNPELCARQKAKGLCLSKGKANIIVLRDGDDYKTFAHELVHVMQKKLYLYQYLEDDFVFWARLNDLDIDEEWLRLFPLLWEKLLEEGAYKPEELKYEFLAFYVQYATNGFEVFLKLVKEAGILPV